MSEYGRLELNITRSPDSSDSFFKENRFPFIFAAVSANGYITYQLQTNSEGANKSNFRGGISPQHFESLARLMMIANPCAAIKAFGVAMQEIKDPREETKAA